MYQSFQCNHLSDAIDIASFKPSCSFSSYAKSFRHLLSIISMLLLYALGALPVLTNAWAEEAAIVISTDNAEEVYFNGVLLGKSNDWKNANSYKVTLQPGKNVLAVKGMDHGGIAALLAEISQGGNIIVSDTSWKVSTTGHAGWEKVGFDDSNWAAATAYGPYGMSPWGKQVAGFPSNSAAQWIWSANWNADDTVYFRYTLTSNSSGNDSIPDIITTDVDKPVKINVLGTSQGTVAIIDAPTKGTASVQADNTILYTPSKGYVGQDTFTYKITGPDGSITIATLTVKVGCTQCSADVDLTLTWKPSAGDVLGYRVYYGPTSGTVTQQLSDLYIATGEVDARTPAVTYNATNHLGMRSGDSVCFKVKAYNAVGESGFSTPACTDI